MLLRLCGAEAVDKPDGVAVACVGVGAATAVTGVVGGLGKVLAPLPTLVLWQKGRKPFSFFFDNK